MTTFQALTIKSSKGILRDIKGDCGVSVAFISENIDLKSVKVLSYIGLWDTGASASVISGKVVKELGLIPISKIRAYHANGESEVNVYLVNIFLPNKVAVQFVEVSEGVLNGFDVLIGMDIISIGDFSITNFDGKTTFSFRIPSLREIDFVEEHNKLNNKLSKTKVGPNDQCPCESGLKYKKCHGKRI